MTWRQVFFRLWVVLTFFEQRQADEGTRVPFGPGLDPSDRDPSGRGSVARV